MKLNILLILIIFSCSIQTCGGNGPTFDQDRSFEYLVKQCDFGPRNPGSDGYEACKQFIIDESENHADDVVLQPFTYTEQKDHQTYDLVNIIARLNTESDVQIMIGAHWDTRPWAEEDLDKFKRRTPIVGANDGASGVAVLLELMQVMSKNAPPVGVNIVFLDGEDLGVPGINESFGQGAHYFAKHLPIPKPDEAIIVDMVGDAQLTLPMERYSYNQNRELVKWLWNRAHELDLSAFQSKIGYAIYDDHVPLYQHAGIPSIDIIDFKYPNSYANYWHTHSDLPENCSAESLGQVGILLTDYIYSFSEETEGGS